MKRVNFPRIVWVSCLFLLLIVILVMVIDYKVHYEYLTEKVLYFYECSGELCVSEIMEEDKLLFSSYSCGEECPFYKQKLEDDYVLLEQEDKLILYDYREGRVISDKYLDYFFLDSENIIVTLKDKKGIINLEGIEVVPLVYQEIGAFVDGNFSGYTATMVIVKKDDKYGILNFKSKEIVEDIKYDEENLGDLLEMLRTS